MRNHARRATRGWKLAGAAAAVFVLLVAIAQVQRSRGHDTAGTLETTDGRGVEATALGPRGDELSVVRRDPGDPLAIGDVDAPVVLVEWLDVRCPFCALFSRQTLPTLIDDYIDAGLVRYEVHPVEFFGDQSGAAAVAVHAAGAQGMAMEYLSALYAAAPERGHPDLTREVQLGFAEQIGIPDMGRFTDDLDRTDLRAAVTEETTNAGGLGVNTVPFFLVGDTAIAGAQSLEVFRDVLDEAIDAVEN